jgi:hypothetical protein
MRISLTIVILTLFSFSMKAQMIKCNSYMEPNPGQCTYSFVFYEAIYQKGELVKKKLVYNVETILIYNRDSLRFKLSERSANLYLMENLYNKNTEFIFTSNGYDTLKTKRKMESPWLTFDVFLTKKKNEDE